jgi:hypothetical protein
MRQLMHRDAAEGQSFVGDGGCGTLAPTVVGMRDRQVHNPTRRHIFAAVEVAVVAALFCGTATWASAATPSGDPGGRVLHQLTPTARALPGYGTVALPWTTQPTMNRAFITTYEPKQDSCGGMPGSRGWSQVVLQSWFTWRNSTPELFTHLGSRMAGLGWHRVHLNAASATHEAMWSKTLTTGKKAVAQLSTAPTKNWWEFVVTAPPVGQAVRGC